VASTVPPERAAVFEFEMGLVSVADANVFQDDPTLAAGDVKVIKDGVLDGNIDTLPSAVTSCTRLITVTLSATEMDADVVTILFHDASGAEWQDAAVSINTTERSLAKIPAFATPIVLAKPNLWWEVSGKTCVAAYQAVGAADYAGSLVNLANPGTLDLTEGSAPSWDAQLGWSFNGSTQYLDTGYNDPTGCTVIVRFANATLGGGGRAMCGSIDDHGGILIACYWWASSVVLSASQSESKISSATTSDKGVWALAARDFYQGGVNQDSLSSHYSTSSNTIAIGCARQPNGTPNAFYAGDILAVAIYSDTLTAGQVADVSDKMAHLGYPETGWWTVPGKTCVAAYQPMGATNLSGSYVNIADPGTHDTEPGVAPTWSVEDGWIFNGSTQYLTTDVVPTNAYSFAVRFTGGTTSWRCAFGSTKVAFMMSDVANRVVVAYGVNTNYGPENTGNSGIAGISGLGDSNFVLYLNGEYASSSGNWVSGESGPLFIGARNAEENFWPGAIQAVAFYDSTLSATEMADLYDAMLHIGEPSTAMPSSPLPPVRGKAYKFDTALVSRVDTTIFQVNPTLEAGDVIVVGDGVLLDEIANLPVAITSITQLLRTVLNVNETDYDRVAVLFHDVADGEWQDHLEMVYTSNKTLSRISQRSSTMEFS
jgi:hypothetical protein